MLLLADISGRIAYNSDRMFVCVVRHYSVIASRNFAFAWKPWTMNGWEAGVRSAASFMGGFGKRVWMTSGIHVTLVRLVLISLSIVFFCCPAVFSRCSSHYICPNFT